MSAEQESPMDISIQARRDLHAQISSEFGFLTVEEVVQMLGIAKHYSDAEAYRDHLLWVNVDWKAMFPRFQFVSSKPRPVIKDLVELSDKYHRTRSGLVYWLMSPTTYLAGKRPVDVIDEPQRLMDTAEAEFGVEW